MENNVKINKFNWSKFLNYVNTYDPKLNGLSDSDIIVKDILYGIGICIKDDYQYIKGYTKFIDYIKNNY